MDDLVNHRTKRHIEPQGKDVDTDTNSIGNLIGDARLIRVCNSIESGESKKPPHATFECGTRRGHFSDHTYLHKVLDEIAPTTKTP